MTDTIDELQRAYRELKAPPHLPTRIRAEVRSQRVRGQSWMPASATIMAIVLLAWLLPYVAEQSASLPTTPSKPSLSAIAALKPAKPAHVSVSLSQLKTVKQPKLPAKPRLKATKPQTKLEIESDLSEENFYVLS